MQPEDSEGFASLLTYANGVTLHLASIRGRKVVSPLSRDALLGQHDARRAADTVRKQPAQGITYIFHRAPPSYAPLDGLTKIGITELVWAEVHRDRVLVVRILSVPRDLRGATGEAALLTVVEDEHGACHNLRVYNLYARNQEDARAVLPPGVVLAIKEPYCEAAVEATSGIRVDHPSDIVYLVAGDKLYPKIWCRDFQDAVPSEILKDEGNAAFKAQSYRLAILKYTEGLHLNPTPALSTSLLLNRAQANLQRGTYTAAIDDAQNILSQAPSSEKALFRGARALYSLGRYSEALSLLEKLLVTSPTNRETRAEFARTKQRVEEQNSGRYDWVAIISDARKAAPRIEGADFIGPVSSKGEIEPVRTVRDVKFGELLLCCKATAVVYPPEVEGKGAIFDATRRLLGGSEGWALTCQIAKRIESDPGTAKAALALGKGLKVYDEEAEAVEGYAAVDVHLIDAIREVHAVPFLPLHPLVPSNNASTQGLGLWPLAARPHLAHSCLPNAVRSFLGDVLVLRACRPIATDEQITIAHVHPALPLSERKAELARVPGSSCACSLCVIEEEEGPGVRQQRMEIVQQVKKLSERAPSETLRTHAPAGQPAAMDSQTRPSDDAVRAVAAEVESLCDALEATYANPAAAQPRLPLLEPLAYLFACYLYLGVSRTEDALRVNARLLTALGFTFRYTPSPDAATEKSGGGDVAVVTHGLYHPLVVRTLVQQSSVCWQLGKRRTAVAWRRVAEGAMEVVAGHKRLFGEAFSAVYGSLGWEA